MAALRFWFYPEQHVAREIWTRCLSAGVRGAWRLENKYEILCFRRELLYNP